MRRKLTALLLSAALAASLAAPALAAEDHMSNFKKTAVYASAYSDVWSGAWYGSAAKLCYEYCRDGISNTFSITPGALGKTDAEQVDNLVAIMGGYFAQNAHHLNVNVLNRDTLLAAYEHPEQYPNLTIRVSGYAVNFYKLSREQQREVISRTFHEAI